MPLRGSSYRPMKPIVGRTPRVSRQRRRPGVGGPRTPFGITTASPPRCSTCIWRATSDTAIRPDPLQHGRTDLPPRSATATGWWRRGRWRRSGRGPACRPATTGWRRRLVHVHHVEVALPQPPAHPGGRHRPELQPGHRAVVRTGTVRPASTTSAVRVSSSAGASTATWWPMPRSLGQVADVRLDAAGDVPRVRADQADPHDGRPAGAARPGGSGDVGPDAAEHVPVLGRPGDPSAKAPATGFLAVVTRSVSWPGPSR